MLLVEESTNVIELPVIQLHLKKKWKWKITSNENEKSQWNLTVSTVNIVMKVMKDGEDVIQSYLIINSHDSISGNTMKLSKRILQWLLFKLFLECLKMSKAFTINFQCMTKPLYSKFL